MFRFRKVYFMDREQEHCVICELGPFPILHGPAN